MSFSRNSEIHTYKVVKGLSRPCTCGGVPLTTEHKQTGAPFPLKSPFKNSCVF